MWQVLFFARLAADVCGRTLPRVKRLAVKSRYVLFSFGLIMTVSIPGYLYYIKQTAWHNDWFVIGGFGLTIKFAHFASYSTFDPSSTLSPKSIIAFPVRNHSHKGPFPKPKS